MATGDKLSSNELTLILERQEAFQNEVRAVTDCLRECTNTLSKVHTKVDILTDQVKSQSGLSDRITALETTNVDRSKMGEAQKWFSALVVSILLNCAGLTVSVALHFLK